jgi:hypothetical protein
MPKSKKKTNDRPSVVYTALICVGLLLAVTGAVVAVLGLGGAAGFQGNVAGVTVGTTSVGLVIMVTGALLAGVVAIRLPADVRVFGHHDRPSLEDRARQLIKPALALCVIGLALLVLSLVG